MSRVALRLFLLLSLFITIVFILNPKVYIKAKTSEFDIRKNTLERYNGSSAKVTIPNGVKIINMNAFIDNIFIQEVVIPKGVTLIGNNAFRGCINLEKVSLPNTLNTICQRVFEGCSSLKRCN